MPRPKRQKTEIFNDNQEKDRLDTNVKKSLMISKTKYTGLLRRDCKHSNYVNAFSTLRKQADDFCEAVPTFDDFIVGTETFYFDLPYPIVEPYVCDEETDFCVKLFEEKSKYRDKLKRYLHHYKTDQKWLTKAYVEKTKYAKLPRYMIDLAVGNIRDPDEQFEGIYNWYYTGGILSKFYNSDDNKYLVCPLPNNNLRIVNTNDYLNDAKIVEMHKLIPDSSPILNLSVNNDDNGDKVLVTRQRNSINILHILGDNDFSLLHIFKVATKNKNPFLDVKRNCNEIAYVNYNRKLTIMNIDDRNPKSFKFQKSHAELSDPFCQLEYLNETTLGFIDRNTLRFLDTRSFDEQILDMNDELFLCDDLCYVEQLKDSPYLFLATIHNIKKLDVRTNKIVKTWAHMLAGQPSMVKTEKSVYGTIFFISSERYNERVFLCSNQSESNLVQLVPNNYETLKKCNIMDFDLNSEMYENRLKFSTAGIEVIQNKQDLSLCTCNTLGDIFKITVRTARGNVDLTLSEFTNWRQNFKRKPATCIVTHLKDMSNAKFILKKPVREDALKRYTKPNRKRSEYIAEKTIEGSAFAHIWISDETVREESLAPPISTDSKVSDWLEGVNYELTEEE